MSMQCVLLSPHSSTVLSLICMKVLYFLLYVRSNEGHAIKYGMQFEILLWSTAIPIN